MFLPLPNSFLLLLWFPLVIDHWKFSCCQIHCYFLLFFTNKFSPNVISKANASSIGFIMVFLDASASKQVFCFWFLNFQQENLNYKNIQFFLNSNYQIRCLHQNKLIFIHRLNWKSDSLILDSCLSHIHQLSDPVQHQLFHFPGSELFFAVYLDRLQKLF